MKKMEYNFLTRHYIFKKIDFKYFSVTSIFNYILNGCHNKMTTIYNYYLYSVILCYYLCPLY